jgi:hypothetical protein
MFIMGREIKYRIEKRAGVTETTAGELDSYKDKLLKLIPAEIVAAFLTLKGVLDAAQHVERIDLIQWIVFAGLLIFTPLFYRYVYKVKDVKQHLITALAFVVWVFTVGGPFDQFFLDTDGQLLPVKGILASILLVFFTLSVPLLMQAEDPEPG